MIPVGRPLDFIPVFGPAGVPDWWLAHGRPGRYPKIPWQLGQEIMRRRERGESQVYIAKCFGISQSSVSYMLRKAKGE